MKFNVIQQTTLVIFKRNIHFLLSWNDFDVSRLLANLEQLSESLSVALSEIFYADAVEEWVSVNITPMLTKMRRIIGEANEQLAVGGRTRNPSLNTP